MKILLVVTRRIGDVLLTTPLIRSLRRAWPDAQLDVLVFAGTDGVLAGNPDISNVLVIPQRMKFGAHLKFLVGLWRKYDLALSTMPGDRPTLYAALAGKRRVGLVMEGKDQQWKHKLLSDKVLFDNVNTHTVLMNLKLAEVLNIQPHYQVSVHWQAQDEVKLTEKFDTNQPFAVLHTHPMYAYKAWHKQGWLDVARWLQKQGLCVVLTGGNSTEEVSFAQQLMQELPQHSVNLVAQAKLPEVAYLLSNARAYVGPDTVVTHMAAAIGTPTVALFGPSNPVKWGPWPKGYSSAQNPYEMRGVQRVNNVVLLQGEGECVPCFEEGCDRHIHSLSRCLQGVAAERVITYLSHLI